MVEPKAESPDRGEVEQQVARRSAGDLRSSRTVCGWKESGRSDPCILRTVQTTVVRTGHAVTLPFGPRVEQALQPTRFGGLVVVDEHDQTQRAGGVESGVAGSGNAGS